MQEETLQKNIDAELGNLNAPKKTATPYGKLKPLRTYQGDVSEAIGKTKASVITITVAEQKRKSKIEPEEEPDHSARNKFFIFGGAALFVLGILTVGVFYYMAAQNKTAQVAQDSAVLSYDQEIKIPVAGESHDGLVQEILEQEKSFNMPADSVLYINTTDETLPADVQTLLPLVAPQIPSELLRNLSPNYMLGVYSSDKNQPFIFLTVDDYGAGFSGMLKWENTMVSDLGTVFSIDASSSPSGGYVFKDESLNNKDLRIVQDKSRQTVLLYSFIDKNTVMITTDENTFNTLLNKYLTGKIVQ